MEFNDSILAAKVREEACESSLKILIAKHSFLFYNIYKKYEAGLISAGVDICDFLNEKDYLIYKTALSFRPDKGAKFSTWLGNQVRYECLNTMNARKTTISMEPTDLQIAADKTPKTVDNKEETREYIFSILKQLKDPRIEQVYKLRYFDGRKNSPWHRVSAKMKISIQTAINLHEKGQKFLKNKLISKAAYDLV